MIVIHTCLNTHLQGPDIIIHQSEEVLQAMNDWCITQHGQVLTVCAALCVVDIGAKPVGV